MITASMKTEQGQRSNPQVVLIMFPTTVQFGTRLAVASLLDDDDDDNHKYEPPPISIDDSCSNDTVQCDAVRDCMLGSDETNCGE